MDTKIINISIPKQLLEMIDEVADAESRTRSEFFREAARHYMAEMKERFHASRAGTFLERFDKDEFLRWFEEYRQKRRVVRRAKRIFKHRKSRTAKQ
jgi:Arc/MetJ-type ribon-helix-helix transcriptional regulator